jgi:hypothetical protein
MESLHDMVRSLASRARYFRKQMPVGGPLRCESDEQYRERIVMWINDMLQLNESTTMVIIYKDQT